MKRVLGAVCRVLGASAACRMLGAVVVAALLPSLSMRAQDRAAAPPDAAGARTLAATDHAQLPRDLDQLWMAPNGAALSRARGTAATRFAEAVKLEVDSKYAQALPILSERALQEGTLGGYGQLYKGLAELRLGHAADARATFAALRARQPVGYVAEAAALREAEAADALGDHGSALAIYATLARTPTTAPDDVLMRLARAAKATGDLDKAANTFGRVLYEYPLGDLAPVAATEMESLPNVQPIAPGNDRYTLELGRAERLFGARRYGEARSAFEALRSAATGDDHELVSLRLAECDYFLRRPRAARDALRPYVDHASRQGEALYFYAIATRDLGNDPEYLDIVHRIVAELPGQTWAEEALNNLATYYILQDDDDQADQVFREMYGKFPQGRYAERAAWKIGWYAYKQHRYADAIGAFERAAADFPHSNYRPAWVYWSGRAHDAANQTALANARYTLVATDYLNTYYGRLAVKRITDRGGLVPAGHLVVDVERDDDGYDSAPAAAPELPLPANATLIRELLGLELYDQAIDELHYAQKVWGDSSAIQATFGWIYNKRGDLRAGINAMKRAYPQYMAAGGEEIPTALLRIIFPVNYWSLIRRYSEAHDLDPYMMAALIAQESNFTPDIRSAANAYGLMQLLPSTGRTYARRLRLRYSLRLLTTAEPNLKLGTAYFADLVKQFGGTYFALASYNAGESRIVRWKADRPGFDPEEFVDDIPFPETQNYVKKILGTTEDYRRLYAGETTDDAVDATPAVSHGTAAPVKKAVESKTTRTRSKKAATHRKKRAKKQHSA